MKRTALVLTSILAASTLALPFAAQASDADGQYGLIDYKMGIATPPSTETPMQVAVVTPTIGTRSGQLNQYGLVDLKLGTAPAVVTSDNSAALPVSEQLKSDVGIADNATDAMARDAVVTADGGAVGTIDHVIRGTGSDTVFVRVSDNVKDRTVSMFRIDVPKGAVHHHMLHLSWTMSDLLDTLQAQA